MGQRSDIGCDAIGQIRPGQNREHTGMRALRLGFNRENPRMGMGRPQKRRVDHARELQIIDKTPAPLKQPIRIRARHTA